MESYQKLVAKWSLVGFAVEVRPLKVKDSGAVFAYLCSFQTLGQTVEATTRDELLARECGALVDRGEVVEVTGRMDEWQGRLRLVLESCSQRVLPFAEAELKPQSSAKSPLSSSAQSTLSPPPTSTAGQAAGRNGQAASR